MIYLTTINYHTVHRAHRTIDRKSTLFRVLAFIPEVAVHHDGILVGLGVFNANLEFIDFFQHICVGSFDRQVFERTLALVVVFVQCKAIVLPMTGHDHQILERLPRAIGTVGRL